MCIRDRCFGFGAGCGISAPFRVREISICHKLRMPVPSVAHIWEVTGPPAEIAALCSAVPPHISKATQFSDQAALLLCADPGHLDGLQLTSLAQASAEAQVAAGFPAPELRPESLKVDVKAANRMICRFLKV
eukprot:TRINITY_DN30260_c0_g1_i1.p1 TRINITY_DN30260_c0_g1~~TRINITY_DN30260_c0_g1_i1.p1  ORF type:complete len:132 (+),score=41.59 TRINITY_DN30260_c0_g1_i1:66-461(+)